MANEATHSSIDPANLFTVEDQVAVVTGGGTGIGLMIATTLEGNGATVYIVGRRLDVLEKAALENNRYGKIIPLQGDITSRESLLSMVETVKARHGYIDLLVNNAGIARNLLPPRLPSPLDEYESSSNSPPSIKAFQNVLWDTGSPGGFAETFETNTTAIYYTTVAFLELLHHGNIRRGHLPPLVSSTKSASQHQQSSGEKEPSSSQSSASSTPSAAYHSLPPTPPSPSSPLSPDPVATLPPPSPPRPYFYLPPIPRPTSHVITISSSGSFRVDARVLSVSYTLAKSACTHLGKLLANLLSDWGIRSNVLAPGVWPSEMTSTQHLTPALLARSVPLGRAGTLSDMAGPILFLAGPSGAYVNGAVWLVDGGRVGSVASSY
ncbi:NAD(P)-binding protein [Hygrophoropsis aurantiaca]|uniref:NAD(P)-binding protein n=1 Tax=Hygrophoropsis aurantiaca TaxID=72124 RepID=A0ACB8ALC6_9AGAM|nr:NAD(P)-binding protein [Hygrophoropsis aurantiaca]